MEKEILIYCFGVILPTIFLLYSIAHSVFIIGEYKTNNKKLPYVIIMTVVRQFVNLIMLTFSYHILFDFDIQQCNWLSAIFVISMGVLIDFDSIIINKISSNIFKYEDKSLSFEDDFNRFVGNKCIELFSKYKYLYYSKALLLLIILVTSLLAFFIPVCYTVYIMIAMFFLYVFVNYEIWKYIKSIRDE